MILRDYEFINGFDNIYAENLESEGIKKNSLFEQLKKIPNEIFLIEDFNTFYDSALKRGLDEFSTLEIEPIPKEAKIVLDFSISEEEKALLDTETERLCALGEREYMEIDDDILISRIVSMADAGIDLDKERALNEYGNGTTELIIAVKAHKYNVVETLLDLGADINKEIWKNTAAMYTPLYSAVTSRNLDMVELLVERGASLNYPPGYTMSPLAYAIYMRNYEIAEYLVEHGADPNLKNMHGKTAIMNACDKDNVELVEFLIEYGADVNAVMDAHGQKITPLSIAREHGNKEMIVLLLRNGAKQIVKKCSAVTLLKSLGMEDGKIYGYLMKTYPEYEKDNFMISTGEAKNFMQKQIKLKLKYAEPSKDMILSKEYLEFTHVVPVEEIKKKHELYEEKQRQLMLERIARKRKAFIAEFTVSSSSIQAAVSGRTVLFQKGSYKINHSEIDELKKIEKIMNSIGNETLKHELMDALNRLEIIKRSPLFLKKDQSKISKEELEAIFEIIRKVLKACEF